MTYQRIRETSHLNAYITVRDINLAMAEAKKADLRYKIGMPLSPIDGIPISIKDNILVKDLLATGGSQIMKDFISPEDATLVTKIKEKGAIITGKVNLDEFGLGSYGFYGYEGKYVKNPINDQYFAGGSSSGSAASVGAGSALASIGTDTGGSVNFPAACCGLYSLKPSFGRISRYGLMLYGSSTDCPGIMANDIKDVYDIFNIVNGKDDKDSNCIDFSNVKRIRNKNKVLDREFRDVSIRGMTFGIIDEFDITELDETNRNLMDEVIRKLKDRGATIKRCRMPLVKYGVPLYYTLLPIELASNLFRMDGIKYGNQLPWKDGEVFQEYVARVRSTCLGVNSKRRSLLGTFLLSTRDGMDNGELELAQKIRHRMVEEYSRVMEWNGISCFVTPVSIGKVPKISDLVGESESKIDPVTEYVNDYYTVYNNLIGGCGITIPYKINKNDEFPSSVRLLGYYGEDYHLLRVAKTIDDMMHDRDVKAKDWLGINYKNVVDS